MSSGYTSGYSSGYSSDEPARSEVDARPGPLLLEFGSNECGHCRRAMPLVAQALAAHPPVPHLKIADGPGRPLGRSFKVRLWPTLVFLKDGAEVARVVRPTETSGLEEGLRRLQGVSAGTAARPAAGEG